MLYNTHTHTQATRINSCMLHSRIRKHKKIIPSYLDAVYKIIII
jgi:hypothetical protein